MVLVLRSGQGTMVLVPSGPAEWPRDHGPGPLRSYSGPSCGQGTTVPVPASGRGPPVPVLVGPVQAVGTAPIEHTFLAQHLKTTSLKKQLMRQRVLCAHPDDRLCTLPRTGFSPCGETGPSTHLLGASSDRVDGPITPRTVGKTPGKCEPARYSQGSARVCGEEHVPTVHRTTSPGC